MPHEIVIVPPSDSIGQLQDRLRGKEDVGFQLVTVGLGFADGKRAILATYLTVESGNAPPPLVLKDIGPGSIHQQETGIFDNEPEGTLISYAGVLISGNETNIAVYRKPS